MTTEPLSAAEVERIKDAEYDRDERPPVDEGPRNWCHCTDVICRCERPPVDPEHHADGWPGSCPTCSVAFGGRPPVDPLRWYAEGDAVCAGVEGDEHVIGLAASQKEAEDIASQHNAALASAAAPEGLDGRHQHGDWHAHAEGISDSTAHHHGPCASPAAPVTIGTIRGFTGNWFVTPHKPAPDDDDAASPAPEGLDEVQAALPEGWSLMVGYTTECPFCPGWWATASKRPESPADYSKIVTSESDRPRGSHHDATSTEAIRALLRRLSDTGERPYIAPPMQDWDKA